MADFSKFKAKCEGFSHKKNGTVCQDSTDAHKSDKIAICVVSDGHGSEKYFRSDKGSDTAVKVAIEAVKQFDWKQRYNTSDKTKKDVKVEALSMENYNKLFNELARYIVAQWFFAVEAHWKENTPNEAEQVLFEKHFAGKDVNITKIYGATLIIGVMTAHFSFVVQIGDGAAVIIPQNGEAFIPPETVDENQGAGQTNSLSSSNCLERFRYYYTEEPLKAIVVTTDGVTDSYGGNDGKDLLRFCEKLVDLHIEDDKQAKRFLNDWLPRLSEQGSQDDMSVAGIYDASSRVTESTPDNIAPESEIMSAAEPEDKPEPEPEPKSDTESENDNPSEGETVNEKSNTAGVE
ncbi:MAG: protein phosphatase 2C domain-containing protein [Oscillospiraceae bacterium]|nr:protein phosphatase 2C domain-containing protein [Oscillospiraceae bacterium]